MTHGGAPDRLLPDYDGVLAASLAAACGATAVHIHDAVDSTMDAAHAAAHDGAPHGTVVVADRQRRGRGRGGRSWSSEPRAGVWTSVVLRHVPADAQGVLSLRIGLALADHLAPHVEAPVTLKWPNDCFVGAGKLAGVLVEARWRGDVAEWIVAGVGVNVRVPPPPLVASAVRPGVARPVVLAAVVQAIVVASRATGALTAAECAAWEGRDRTRGRRCVAPVVGVIDGIERDGALRVLGDDGAVLRATAGSLVLEEG
jgi:BirA family biotin operon repressor/biotin-[acetyl-CoA-carboxylase] ligase